MQDHPFSLDHGIGQEHADALRVFDAGVFGLFFWGDAVVADVDADHAAVCGYDRATGHAFDYRRVVDGVAVAAVVVGVEKGRGVHPALSTGTGKVRTGSFGGDAFAGFWGSPVGAVAAGFVLEKHQVAAGAAGVLHIGEQGDVAGRDGVVFVPLHGRSQEDVWKGEA